MYLLVYVDDIVLTGNNSQFISRFLGQLAKTFAIKDLGNLHYFLGISVQNSSTGLMLSQRQYILDLLDRTHMIGCKPISTAMSPSQSLSRLGGTPMDDPTLYRSVVGGLQYATLTRPDISFAINKVCQFMHRPCTEHWAAVKRILRYLKSTIDHGLYVHRQPTLQLSAYSDADWAGCPDDRKSTGGFAIYHGTNLISWSSRKQATVARSSTELEYRAIANAAAEITWLQSLLKELGMYMAQAPILWCDNVGATYLTANPVFHACTKHVEIDFHFVRDKVAKGDLDVRFISTKDQIADIFTKALASKRYTHLLSKLKVHPTLHLRGRVNDKPISNSALSTTVTRSKSSQVVAYDKKISKDQTVTYDNSPSITEDTVDISTVFESSPNSPNLQDHTKKSSRSIQQPCTYLCKSIFPNPLHLYKERISEELQ
ncbi:uncharacterized mitochondrial protein AtMg00810-like [Telopea speciosissima]|uniref:uncharacterized mitochondrial protein AtMg00810-like n=1 Tax=Telopea speciosissima TaxID=54955 RepID=UPI001CC3CC39|nr:uncharacterized mitochondrial protein AtMg00810-like [Telopea speciosissima]